MFPLLTDLVDARVNIDVIQRAFAITTKAFLQYVLFDSYI